MGKNTLTTEIFIERAKKIHGNKYDYSLVNYVNSDTKVKIICLEHGIFEQIPYSHYNGLGCAKCGNQFLGNDFFIKKSNLIHNNKYDYSLVDYIGSKIKIKIICPQHGIFEQKPYKHLIGQGCPKCMGKNKTTNEFIKEAAIIHKNKYDYSLINYFNNVAKVKIICPLHGEFLQRPNSHLRGNGCPTCNRLLISKLKTKSQKQYIDDANLIHNNKYDYSLLKYISSRTKVEIICPIHGMFNQLANSHLRGSGCPQCKQSKGELKINQFLINNNIEFNYQKTFIDCIHRRRLRFDFYLPDYDTCIEYDGKQHFKLNEYFGGIKSLKSQQRRDIVKNKYCEETNKTLIRIRYDENVEEKLKELLAKLVGNKMTDVLAYGI